MEIQFRPLSAQDGKDIYDMLQEIPGDENGFINAVQGKSFEDYELWLAEEEAASHKTGLEDGWKVPQSTFWLYADGVPAGMVRLRHFLTEGLLKNGGSIGYAVRPSQRGKGYGKILLRCVLDKAWAMGIDRVLLTVHSDNHPSLRTALACNGLIEKVSDGMHFIWISRPVS